MDTLLEIVRMIVAMEGDEHRSRGFHSLETSIMYSAPEQIGLRAGTFEELMNDYKDTFTDSQMDDICNKCGCANPRNNAPK